jgi:hypothetical protein
MEDNPSIVNDSFLAVKPALAEEHCPEANA